MSKKITALIPGAALALGIAYGMSATFLFDTVMIVVFPLLGRWLGLSDAAFGLWAGTAQSPCCTASSSPHWSFWSPLVLST